MAKYNVYTKETKRGTIMKTDERPYELSEIAIKLNKTSGNIFITLGIIGISVFSSLIFFGDFYDEDQLILPLAFILLSSLAIWGGVKTRNRHKEIEAEWLAFCDEMKAKDDKYFEEHPFYDGECLYKKCREKDIDINSAAGKARLLLVAKELEINGSEQELTELYLKGKEIIKACEKEQKQKDLEEKVTALKKEEKELQKASETFKDLHGQEKRLTMVNVMLKDLRKKLTVLEEKRTTAINFPDKLYYQKESDWSILGGIASGIAGPAAGISVAVNTQLKNAAIRAQNEEVRQMATQAVGHILYDIAGEQISVEKKIQSMTKIAEATKLKLVEEHDKKQLLEKLSPTVISIEKTLSGSYQFQVKTSAAKFKIFDSVDAVVDGTFKATLKANGKKIGTAYFTLPYNGSENTCTLYALCTDVVSSEEDCEVIFEPYNLFAIETI